jgi:hypothetical protein
MGVGRVAKEEMQSWVKWGINFGFSFAVGFYTSFVLMMLWDWFVTGAFHVEEIRYWNMVGLVYVVRLLKPSGELMVVEKWGQAMKMLEACIPEEQRAETMGTIKKEAMSENAQLWMASVMTAASSTLSLMFGWAVHTFLM